MTQAEWKKIVTRLDRMFSEYVRRRAIARSGGCERCHKPKRWQDLQCAHMFSRRGLSTRWLEEDAAGLCGGDHMFLDSHPIEKIEFFKALLGEDRFQLLNITAHMAAKPDYKLIELYLKQLLEGVDNG